MHTVLVSVIIPVYNVELYLQRCLESVINQSYSNLEIICIDDGSTDNSRYILDEYKKKDTRMQVVYKNNGGQTSARKVGVEIASGEYIAFVDSDDWIEKNMISVLVDEIIKSNSDIVLSLEIRDYGSYSLHKKSCFKTGLYINEELKDLKCKLIDLQKFFISNVSGHLVDKIYKSEIIKKIQKNIPDIIRISEDGAVSYQCILEANSILVTEYSFYHYCIRSDSITGTKKENDSESINVFKNHIKNTFNKYEKEVPNIMDQMERLCFYTELLQCPEQIIKYENGYLCPYGIINKEEKILIYGAGKFGAQLYDILSEHQWFKKLTWADKDGSNGACSVHEIDLIDFDKILIASIKGEAVASIYEDLVNFGVNKDRILKVEYKKLEK